MGTLFRSQDMALCQIILQSEAAYAVLAELGEIGIVHFRDIGEGAAVFQRTFAHEVQTCASMEQVLEFFNELTTQHNVTIDALSADAPMPEPKEYLVLLEVLTQTHDHIYAVQQQIESLEKKIIDLRRQCAVMEEAENFLDEAHISLPEAELALPAVSTFPEAEGQFTTEMALMSDLPSLQLNLICGVVPTKIVTSLERILWRLCRGNILFKHNDITFLAEDNTEKMSVFIIIVQGAEFKKKVKKICVSYHTSLYHFPHDSSHRDELLTGLRAEISDVMTTITQSNQYLKAALTDLRKEIPEWTTKVRKIKALFYALNLFNMSISERCLIGECWIPKQDLDRARVAIERGTNLSQTDKPSLLIMLDSKLTPPTYLKTNKFTDGFQAIVNSYGVPCYKEANPAVFTIITFPFLFAVMFGDAGHGIIMTAFALLAIWNEKTLIRNGFHRGEMTGIMFGGRYIVLLMGLFSIYTGMIYNDVFGRSVNIFGSAWNARDPVFNLSGTNVFAVSDSDTSEKTFLEFDLDPTQNAFRTRSPYPFGQDPVWEYSKNKIAFSNSYKMKMSIIFGVLQMAFGIAVGLTNHIHHGDWVAVIGEFIPRMLFLLCLFGYLVVVIFYKWIKFDVSLSGCAPSLLIGLIGMFMFQSADNPINDDGTVCEKHWYYPNQQTTEHALVLVALFAVPWMLLFKPLYMKIQQNRAVKMGVEFVVQSGHGEGGQDEPFAFSSYMIYQGIHTIEFVLGIISNTASYLRLWALSLAHAQLAEVLWTMVMSSGLDMTPLVLPLMIIFCGWSVLTVGILIFMEGLSAFLHALRLHWVEFQNKFYIGEGHLFEPFSFRKMLDMD